MTFKVEVLRTANTVSDHIDMMDFLNHNEDPLLKKLGEPYTHFLWQMMADKYLLATLNKFETVTGQVVYMIGMTINGLDYVISTADEKVTPPDPFSVHKAKLWDELSTKHRNNKLRIIGTDEQRRTLGDLDVDQLLHYLELTIVGKDLGNA